MKCFKLISGVELETRAHKMRILTACIYYVVAKVEGYVLLDVDFLPLQGEYWQTDQMLSAYFSLLSSRFSTPNCRKRNLDFTIVGSIVTGSGVQAHLNKGIPLPMTSVCNTGVFFAVHYIPFRCGIQVGFVAIFSYVVQ